MTVTKIGLAGLVLSFAWQAVPLAAPALAKAAQNTPPVQPLNGTPAITANFGAHGPGPVSDPDAYFSGQFHLGTDYGAAAGTPVVAPVSGTIVYYHQLRNSPREVRLLDTFFVLRGDDGRDYIFAHVVCSVCVATPPVGDPDAYPKANWRPVTAGDPIGTVADLKAEAKRLGYSASVGNHLHLGVVQGQIVDDEGRLKTAYRGGDWSRLLYDKAEDANPVTAIARAEANGFVDPKNILASKSDITIYRLLQNNTSDIWTTSVFPYDGRYPNVGGGLDNDELRVGGWGDEYRSLIRFNLIKITGEIESVHLIFTLRSGPQNRSGYTGIWVDRITSPWNWRTSGSGRDLGRLWWRDRPSFVPYLPVPITSASAVGEMRIDITEIYKGWLSNSIQNHGIQLRPVSTDNKWVYLYSSQSEDPEKAPRLEIKTAPEPQAATLPPSVGPLLGPGLQPIAARSRRDIPAWKYRLGKMENVGPMKLREYSVGRVEKDPYGAGLICRVMMLENIEWWTRCSELSPPPGGWASVKMVTGPTAYPPPQEGSPFPPGYYQAYRNYIAMLPAQFRNVDWYVYDGYIVYSPPEKILFGGRSVYYLSSCRPHDCASNRVSIFLEQDRKTAKAILVNNDRPIFLGGAGPAETRCLARLEASGWQAKRC